MPKVPIDYYKTVIYKLVHKDDLNDVNIYVGHTTNFTERKRAHKTTCINPKSKDYNIKVYRYIRDNGGLDEWVMLKIEDYPCKDVYEAKKRERYWIKELKPILNTSEPCRTNKEYYEDNRDKILEKVKKYNEENPDKKKQCDKKYYDQNKDKILEQLKEHYENNKDKILEQKKEHYENNKDKILEQKKEYYEKNKDKIIERLNEKIKCEKCGCEIRRNSLSRHKKTFKCQNHGSQ